MSFDIYIRMLRLGELLCGVVDVMRCIFFFIVARCEQNAMMERTNTFLHF